MSNSRVMDISFLVNSPTGPEETTSAPPRETSTVTGSPTPKPKPKGEVPAAPASKLRKNEDNAPASLKRPRDQTTDEHINGDNNAKVTRRRTGIDPSPEHSQANTFPDSASQARILVLTSDGQRRASSGISNNNNSNRGGRHAVGNGESTSIVIPPGELPVRIIIARPSIPIPGSTTTLTITTTFAPSGHVLISIRLNIREPTGPARLPSTLPTGPS